MDAVDLQASVDGAVDAPVAFVGVLELDVSPDGIGPRRLPAWTRAQIPDAFMDAMVSMTSGVRLAFATDSSTIELDVAATTFRYNTSPARSQVFQLVIDGTTVIDAVAESASCFVLDPLDRNNLGFEQGDRATVRFSDLPAGNKQCEIWLPHASTLRIRELRVDDGAVVTAAAPSGRRRWLHYGSSISHCMEADVPTKTWPAVAARAGGVDLHSLGLAGQCQLDQFVARTIRDVPADVISLKLGINIVNGDTMRERAFTPAVHGFLDTVRDGHPQTPILVVSPIFCPSAETNPGPTLMNRRGVFKTVAGHAKTREGCLTLRRIREILATVVATRRRGGDEHLHYLDGLTLFGEGDVGDLPDLLHPNAAGYVRIGQRFAAAAFAPGGALAEPAVR